MGRSGIIRSRSLNRWSKRPETQAACPGGSLLIRPAMVTSAARRHRDQAELVGPLVPDSRPRSEHGSSRPCELEEEEEVSEAPRVNPLTYAVAPLRSVVFAVQHMPPAAAAKFSSTVTLFGTTLSNAACIGITCGFAVVFLALTESDANATGWQRGSWCPRRCNCQT